MVGRYRTHVTTTLKRKVALAGALVSMWLPAVGKADKPYENVLRPGITAEEMAATSKGCLDCHVKTDAPTMHENPAIHIGCAQCHGGDPEVRAEGLAKEDPAYDAAKKLAHVLPRHPENWPTSANPKHSYADLNKEPVEFVRFVNPGDLRAAPEACGGCHSQITTAVKKSLMTTSAMLWGGAAYNNGLLPFKNYLLGESYTKDGEPASIEHDGKPITPEMKARGVLEKLLPMPTWEVFAPADIFRVFERGGFFIKSQFAETGLPNPLEESGKPDVRSSNRGPGTGGRIAVPLLNIHKTRLNDPHLSFLGTNDHPGDYRSSGCTACHAVYANDRDPAHSGPYAKYGHEGKSITADPTIPKDEEGHPLKHVFTRAIPTSQCMVCHMHQPNMFVNTYLGYTMWDYESDAPFMWPEKQKYPTDEEQYKSLLHNPEEAAVRGKWTDVDFLKRVSELNPKLNTTQFADYHGHGWNFRAIFKRDRKGNLLDKNNKIVPFDDPKKFKKAVHLQDIHVDFGMQCVDCHFGQDAHGDGNIYGEVAQAVEIGCEDCHGTISQKATLKTSGPAAATTGGRDLTLKRTPWGESQFVWKGNDLFQRSLVTEGLEWRVKQVRDSVDPASKDYNKKSAKAKLVKKLADGSASYTVASAGDAAKSDIESKLAHPNNDMSCFACHSSWTTACGGCHLPIQANWKKDTNHYEGKETRNWASYNPQVARDEMYQLGRHGPAKNGKIVPVRSSSALVLSSVDSNRQKIYIQQPPTSAGGYSSQAFAPHFPHTVRTTETKDCKDCHVSKENDNNAIMAQLLLLGTNFVNFMGYYTWVAAGHEGLEAIQVTEWDEPQAVIGSYLHKYAYPDYYKAHQDKNLELQESHRHHGVNGDTRAIQMRGEYLYTAAGPDGFRVYDIANVANKGFSERIVTSPVSPLGQDTHVPSKNATGLALPTNMPVAPAKKQLPENLETPMHAIYHYAFISDSEEGLIIVNVDTLQDGEPRNNFLERALTWNENGILTGARNIYLAGARAFIGTEDKVVVVSLEDPMSPRVEATWPANKPTGVAVQFRYAFMTDADGFHVIDITFPEKPRVVSTASIKLPDARSVYVARTYAYVGGGSEGVVIVDVEKPERPKVYMKYTADGEINDTYDVKVATTNASLIGYVADGKNGLKVLQLTDPERVPGFYGFSPPVKPMVIARKQMAGPALAITKPLDRDRAVDETGHQVSVLGRLGSRPFTLEEMRKMFLTTEGKVWTVD